MTEVFVSVAGQNDNLGDSVLRRGFRAAFAHPQVARTHVHVGDNDDDYLSAVGLTGDEILYRSATSWTKALDRSVWRTRTVLGFNAGEVQVTSSRAHLGWRSVGRIRLARLRRGGGIHVGVGIRAPHQGSTRALRAALRSCALVTWRDEPSREAVGIGTVEPDWAFGERSEGLPALTRDRIVVSLRGDRAAPTQRWLDAVRGFADRADAAVVVFSQVRRDNERAEDIARALGAAETITWESGSHADWERRARSLYRSASAVVSDRLHALVIGATEGAVPVGMTVGSPEKLQRTLGAAGLGAFAFGVDTGDDDKSMVAAELSHQIPVVREAVEQARVRLDALTAMIGEHLA